MTYYWDTWDPSYTRPVPDDAAAGSTQDSTASVEVGVEVPAPAWHARRPPGTARAPDVVLFVDGILRNEARGWLVDAHGEAHPTLAASYAAGVVRCDLSSGSADTIAARVERAVLTTAPEVAAVGIGPSRYRAHQVPVGGAGASHQHLDGRLRGLMSALEARVSEDARESSLDGDDDLLVLDGRLRGRRTLPRTIGYVKTQGTRYLPVELVRVVTGLPEGTRTPVFGLSTLYSWYLRLPGPGRGPWAGIVRVECSGDLTPQQAISLADLSTVTLPRFASTPYKDPRAPQNLVPIAGLERRLRGLLGDARLLHRTLVRSGG